MSLGERMVAHLAWSLSEAEKDTAEAKAKCDALNAKCQKMKDDLYECAVDDYDRLRLALARVEGELQHWKSKYDYYLGRQHGIESALIFVQSTVEANERFSKIVDPWEEIA